MEKKIPYRIKRSRRAKRMRLAVYRDCNIVVTSPLGVDQSIIEKFISDKRQWIQSKIKFFKSINNHTIRTFSHKDYRENKDRALALAHERVGFYNKLYGFSFNKIVIRNQKTRWGSCSNKRNLNLNYKIVFLPQEHRDYIIVHEICHLKEFNHSKKFWALVERALPRYLYIKKDLRNRSLLYQ